MTKNVLFIGVKVYRCVCISNDLKTDASLNLWLRFQCVFHVCIYLFSYIFMGIEWFVLKHF